MIANLALLLLPAAAMSGWYCGRKKPYFHTSTSRHHLPQDYFVGLNYLINEQPDKAVDVFVKMLEVNSDTVETHLALGSLFRRRGEVDRAIRVHQNLIARPQLAKQQRIEALSELAQDYLRAGVLDRAERLFLELVESNAKVASSLQNLLHIYQQQKDWEQAITMAQKLEVVSGNNMHSEIAHYYCELAEKMREKNDLETAKRYLRQAISIDRHCVRASIIQAEIEVQNIQYKTAVRHYKQVKNQDPEYISEIIIPLAKCYEQLHEEQEFIDYLQKCLLEHPRISVVIMLSNYMRKWEGDRSAIEFVADQIQQYPSLRGVQHLIQLYLDNSYGEAREKLLILQDLIKDLLADKPIYRCAHCGFGAKTLYWQCPRCRHWKCVKPIHGLEGD